MNTKFSGKIYSRSKYFNEGWSAYIHHHDYEDCPYGGMPGTTYHGKAAMNARSKWRAGWRKAKFFIE